MAKKTLIILSLLGFLGLGYVFYYQNAPTPDSQTITVDSFDNLKSSYQISYEKIGALSLGKKRLVITSSPSKTTVALDGKEKGETPLILEELTSGKHELKLTKEGYEELLISVDLKDSLLTRVTANLLFNPLENYSEVKVRELADVGAAGLEIQNRADWAPGPPRLTMESLTVSDWQRLHLYAVDLPAELGKPVEFLPSLDTLAREKLGLPAVPFAYLIAEDGGVYEGLGVYNFNYEGLMEGFAAGEVPVLILNRRDEVVSDPVKESLAALRENLSTLSRQSAKTITVLDKLTLQAQEKRALTLEFVNRGNTVWRAGETFLEIADGGEDESISEFYSPDDWTSTSQIGSFENAEKEIILPGETAKFSFTLTAPPYPGEFSESVKLLDQTVELKIKVKGEAGRVVKILDTPTGFLNVREGSSIGNALKGVVYPDEKYLVVEESAGWLKLRLRDGSEGWVINRYVENF